MADTLTVAEVARELRVTERTVRNLIGRDRLPAHKIGGVWRIPRTGLLRWMAKRRSKGWRRFTDVGVSGGSGSRSTEKTFGSPADQILNVSQKDFLASVYGNASE